MPTVLLALVVSGCGGGGAPASRAREPELAAEGQRLFSQRRPATPTTNEPGPAQSETPAAEAAPAGGGWTIMIAGFNNPDPQVRAEMARQALWTTQTTAGLTGASLDRRGEAIVLVYGRYADPASREAQRDLERVRSVEIDGARPFATAVLLPPVINASEGTAPEFDLRTVKSQYGSGALYTLQVGAYLRPDRKPPTASDLQEFRRLAEEAVATLRRGGDEAFYYHGPNGSMVTVGVFGASDIDTQAQPHTLGPRVEAVRERHPYNLVNGQAYRVRVRGVPADDPNAWRLQASALVEIPKD